MPRSQETLFLGAGEAIKALFPDSPEKRRWLKKVSPYLSPDEVIYWGKCLQSLMG